MRFSLAVAVVLVGVSVGGWAQQNNNAYKVKTDREPAPKSTVPVGKPTSGVSANAKALQNTERQSTKIPKSGGRKTAPALKPVKDKPNPSINFNGATGGKTAGRAQNSNPYKGRLKQKGAGGSGNGRQ
jgi:hypothetical protein